MKTLPFKYKNILPEEKYLVQSKNPPKVNIEFYEGLDNLKQINFLMRVTSGEIQNFLFLTKIN